MKRQLIVGASLYFLVAGAGCESSAKEQQAKAEQAQIEANEHASKAINEAERDIAKGQAKANQDIRAVHEDLLKNRNEYQVQVHKTVDDLDNRVDTLKVKAQTASAKAKSDVNLALTDVQAKRAIVQQDLSNLESQTADTFDSFKTRVDKEIDALKAAIDNAASKV